MIICEQSNKLTFVMLWKRNFKKKSKERRGVFLFYPSVCFFILSTVVIMISGKDSITVISHKDQPGICQRISNSLMAVIAGFLLLPMSCYLLYYNEVSQFSRQVVICVINVIVQQQIITSSSAQLKKGIICLYCNVPGV